MSLQRQHTHRRLIATAALALALIGLGGPSPVAADAGPARHFYLSLGNSLAESFQPNGDLTHGYAEQLHAALAASDPKLRLVKLGCGGESTVSMRFGAQDPATVLSCATPGQYPKGTQLAAAVKFLRAHRGRSPWSRSTSGPTT